jgi:phage baseplate assembly protein W
MAVNITQAQGMDATTGRLLTGVAHLKQSIQQILTTRIGSRVMRRKFGSTVPDLIDSPANRQTLLQCYAAIAVAIHDFEPRLKLTRIYSDFDTNLINGKATFVIEGDYLGEKITIQDVTV